MANLTLAQIAEKAKSHRMTAAERRAQRVSLMMGLRLKNSSVTREEISEFLDATEGVETREEKRIR